MRANKNLFLIKDVFKIPFKLIKTQNLVMLTFILRQNTTWIRRLLLIQFFVVAFLISANAKVYFVDSKQGNDNNNGLVSSFSSGKNGPWKTLNKVNSKTFSAGDSILFKRGETWVGQLRPKNGGKPGGTIKVEDKVRSNNISFDLVDLKNHNCIYFGAYGNGEKPKIDCNGGFGIMIYHDYLIFENFQVHNGRNAMILFNDKSGNFWNVVRNVDVIGCRGNAVEFFYGGGNILLQNLFIFNYNVNGIYLAGSAENKLRDVLVEGCWVEKPQVVPREDGISCHRRGNFDIQGNIIIRNNTIINSGEDGIDITSGKNILLDGNTIKHSYGGGINIGYQRVSNVEVRGNFLQSNSKAKGIGEMTLRSPNIRAVNNIITGPGHHVLMLEEATNIEIWNNVFAPHNRSGNFIWLRGNKLSGIQFRNNIFDFSRTNAEFNGLIDSRKVNFNNNCYFGKNRSQDIFGGKSFDEFKSLFNDFEEKGFWGNPEFINSSKSVKGDFKLSDSSPCLDKGESIPLEMDIEGNSRINTGGIDLGVYEMLKSGFDDSGEDEDGNDDDCKDQKNVYLSDLKWEGTPTNGWGPIELDQSVGNRSSNDGQEITINGKVYKKGLGVHSHSEVKYSLGGQYSKFLTDIGIDDSTCGLASVIFEVYVDDSKVFESETLTQQDDAIRLDINIEGAQELKLVVKDAGDENICDHANWADAKLKRCGSNGNTPPVANFTATPNTGEGPLEVSLDASESFDNDGSIVEFNWDFGDGTLGVGKTTTHTYDTAGVYQVALLVNDGELISSAFTFITVTDGSCQDSSIDFLSDLNWVGTPINGRGPVERDQNVGDHRLNDGDPISINGKVYKKGLGVHATSSITYELKGEYEIFLADLGIDDSTCDLGSVRFEVYLDGNRVYRSSVIRYGDNPLPISVDVSNTNQLELVVTNADINGTSCDHANWADARLISVCSENGDGSGGGGGEEGCYQKENLAMEGVSGQSSTMDGREASFAVDGDIENSYTVTDLEDNPWWEVDLGKIVNLSQINLWNKSDCCISEDSICYVFLSRKPFSSTDLEITKNHENVSSYKFRGKADEKISLAVGDSARYVRVQVGGKFFLALSEVETFGCIGDEEEKPINNLWFEAECSFVGSAWEKIERENASNGRALVVPNLGNKYTITPPIDSKYHLDFNFNIPQTGNYKLWFRSLSQGGADDSFWVKVNDGDWVPFNNIDAYDGFAWNQVHDSGKKGQIVNFNLLRGNNRIVVAMREDGTIFDKIFLTLDDENPLGIGEKATNCSFELNEGDKIDFDDDHFDGDERKRTGFINPFPNPFTNQLKVKFEELEENEKQIKGTLLVYDMDGRVRYYKSNVNNNGRNIMSIPNANNWESGIYSVEFIQNDNKVYTKRVIKQNK